MIIFTVLLTIVVYLSDTYSLLIYSSILIGISPLVFIFSNGIWPVYVFVVLVSAGTSIYGPRTFDYLVKVAPSNQAALYISTSSVGYSTSILISGLSAGILLNEYVPEDGERQSYMLWI